MKYRNKETGEPVKSPKITAKQENGNDGFCYVIRINGKEFVNGLTRTESAYYRKKALEFYLNQHNAEEVTQ